MIKMVQDTKEAESKWATYHALKMQELWKREIAEAIETVKRRVHDSKCKWRRKKRGYWTPSGFAWFKRKRKSHYNKRGA
jgi:hypothetical protein